MESDFSVNNAILVGVTGVAEETRTMDPEEASALGRYVTRIFERNRDHRLASGVEAELIECLYQADICRKTCHKLRCFI